MEEGRHRGSDYIPSKGYGSLPYSDDAQNPNLVRVYIDAQHDYLLDRTYLLGASSSPARVERNAGTAEERRSAERGSTGHPGQRGAPLRRLDRGHCGRSSSWPLPTSRERAPIHLIFYDDFAQRVLLDGLARHAGKILGATPLYDFVTQLAAFDSPIATFLDREIRDQKNYPMVCQSLQAVAAFEVSTGTRARPIAIFRARLFDFWAKLEPSRRGLGDPGDGELVHRPRPLQQPDPARVRLCGLGRSPLAATQRERRSRAVSGRDTRVANGIPRSPPRGDGAGGEGLPRQQADGEDAVRSTRSGGVRAEGRTLAHALQEFVTIERHVTLAAWKRERLAPPEQRVLAGQTLVVRYLEEDQEPGVAEKNRDNERADSAKRRSAPPTARHTRTPSRSGFPRKSERSRTGRRGCGSGCAWRAPTSPATSTRSWASPR